MRDEFHGVSETGTKDAEQEEQMNNTSANHHIMVDGIKMTVAQAARKYNLDPKKLDMRIIRGWDFERAFEGKTISGHNI